MKVWYSDGQLDITSELHVGFATPGGPEQLPFDQVTPMGKS
jgi:hypothetical protein